MPLANFSKLSKNLNPVGPSVLAVFRGRELYIDPNLDFLRWAQMILLRLFCVLLPYHCELNLGKGCAMLLYCSCTVIGLDRSGYQVNDFLISP